MIEYAGEEVSPGVWQRLQTYCVGGAIIAHTDVVDFHWMAKGLRDKERLERHPGLDRFIAQEHAFISRNLHADVLRRAFDLAGIEYGRADFALVDGRPQIYEINTNPMQADHATLFRDIHPRRAAMQKFSEDAVQAALLATDSAGAGSIRIRDRLLRRLQMRPSLIQRLLRLEVLAGTRIAAAMAAASGFRQGRFADDPLQDDCFHAFYAEVAQRGAESGLARTYRLSCGDATVAMLFGLIEDRRFCYLVLGCDYAGFGNVSPGTLLFDRAMAHWFESGGAIFDFTIGDEAFKTAFGCVRRPMLRFRRGSP